MQIVFSFEALSVKVRRSATFRGFWDVTPDSGGTPDFYTEGFIYELDSKKNTDFPIPFAENRKLRAILEISLWICAHRTIRAR